MAIENNLSMRSNSVRESENQYAKIENNFAETLSTEANNEELIVYTRPKEPKLVVCAGPQGADCGEAVDSPHDEQASAAAPMSKTTAAMMTGLESKYAAKDETDSDDDVNVIIGTEYGECINGTAARDKIFGRGGDDAISGKGGRDTIYGEGGNDVIEVELTGNKVYGGDGKDTISGQGEFYGEDGDDALIIRGKDSYASGGAGNDTIFANNTNYTNVATGEVGKYYADNSTIHGGEGSDLIYTGHEKNDVTVLYKDIKESTPENPDKLLINEGTKVDLTRLSGNLPRGTNGTWADSFTGKTGEFVLSNGRLEADMDGDGKPDFAILVSYADTSKQPNRDQFMLPGRRIVIDRVPRDTGNIA
jgi:RTX calcium-binding nonapeptide repeat (4 copies)